MNKTLAGDLYAKGCTAGHGPSCGRLAFLVEHGTAGAPDRARAHSLYQQACEMGDATGCFGLASIEEAEGNSIAATAMYRTAGRLHYALCVTGEAEHCFELARMITLRKDVGLPSSNLGSTLDRVCDDGEPPVCRQLAEMYEKGLLLPRNPTRAAELRKRLCAVYPDDEGCPRIDPQAEDLPQIDGVVILDGPRRRAWRVGRGKACPSRFAPLRANCRAERAGMSSGARWILEISGQNLKYEIRSEGSEIVSTGVLVHWWQPCNWEGDSNTTLDFRDVRRLRIELGEGTPFFAGVLAADVARRAGVFEIQIVLK